MHSFYEGHAIDHITLPVRIFKLLGVETMIGESYEDEGSKTP